MQFDTYANLCAAIAEYLARDDLTAQIPAFVRLAEVKFNRRLRLAGNETSATLTVTSGVAPLPADYGEWRSVNDAASGQEVAFRAPGAFAEDGKLLAGSRARFFSIVGVEMRVAPSRDVALVYYRGIDPLAGAVGGVNWLLTKHPDIYLYYALAESEPFLKNDGRITLWKSLGDGVFSDMMESDRSARWGRASMRTAGRTP